MTERPQPVIRTLEAVVLIGTMEIYESQAEASQLIPQQWKDFRRAHPKFGNGAVFMGASPCTSDHKIHYLTGVECVAGGVDESVINGERLVLESGAYAVVQVDDPATIRDTWIWLLGTWLPGSERRERNAPEFERFGEMSPEGLPLGKVEIGIPLETVA